MEQQHIPAPSRLVVCFRAAGCSYLLPLCLLAPCRPGDRPPAPRSSFAIHWTQRCEQSWRRAFMAFGLGIPALFVNLSVAAWIKFSRSAVAAASTTIVLGLSLLAMAFFVRKWTSHILDSEKADLVSLLQLQGRTALAHPWTCLSACSVATPTCPSGPTYCGCSCSALDLRKQKCPCLCYRLFGCRCVCRCPAWRLPGAACRRRRQRGFQWRLKACHLTGTCGLRPAEAGWVLCCRRCRPLQLTAMAAAFDRCLVPPAAADGCSRQADLRASWCNCNSVLPLPL